LKNKKTTANTAAAPEISDKLQALTDLALADESDFGSFKIQQADLSFSEAKRCRIENAVFERVTLQSTDLKMSRLTDLRFDGCDFSNAVWCDDKLARVHLVNCKIAGFRLIDSELQNVLFHGCIGKRSQFCGGQYKRVRFEECDLSDADFSDCLLTECTFKNCNLSEAIFYNAKMNAVDLRSSQLQRLKIMTADLHGATVDKAQVMELAPQFATLLGLRVDPD
jgi:uncharacterized protein YjbI with pentapeptide repeats